MGIGQPKQRRLAFQVLLGPQAAGRVRPSAARQQQAAESEQQPHPRRSITERVPFSVAVSLSTRQEEPQLERPPDFGDYRPPRTTAEGGATMLLSGVFLAGAIVVLGLAVYTKLADVRTFGQIGNLLVFAVALLLIAIYLLVWEIALRLIARSDD